MKTLLKIADAIFYIFLILLVIFGSLALVQILKMIPFYLAMFFVFIIIVATQVS